MPGRRLQILGASLVVGLVVFSEGLRPRPPGDAARRADLEWLRGELRGTVALVDGAHVLQHYLGTEYDLRPITVSYDGAAIMSREAGVYRELNLKDVQEALIVVRTVRKGLRDEALKVAWLRHCSCERGNTYFRYKCGAVPLPHHEIRGQRPLSTARSAAGVLAEGKAP
jgi:hypothetical protein